MRTRNALLKNLECALHEFVRHWLLLAIAGSLCALQEQAGRSLCTGDVGERLRGLMEKLEQLFHRDASA